MKLTKQRLQRFSKMLKVENPRPGDLLVALNAKKAQEERKEETKPLKSDTAKDLFKKLAALI